MKQSSQLRHVPQMSSMPFRNTVSYNDYGLDIYKPTEIFHNCPFLSLVSLKTSVGKTFDRSITGMNNAFTRSIVPSKLAQSIIEQIDQHHFQISNSQSL